MPNNHFLIIARVGDKSLHSHWLQGATPEFDLFLSYYGSEQDKYKTDATYYENKKGGKWSEISRIWEEQAALINQYDAVWFPDDDLLINAHQLNRMFAFFKAYELELAQPALSQDSYYSHAQLLQQQGTTIRYTNFIEVMAPIFSKTALQQLGSSFSQSRSGWGLDFLWPQLLPEQSKVAIIDAVTVVHTRPVGGELYKNNPELSPKTDMVTLSKAYPHLHIGNQNYLGRFRILGQIREIRYNTDWMATLIGWWQKRRAKAKGKAAEKYPANP